MKQRPILFSTPMIRAILAGRKTQTRRIIKPMRSQKWLKEETLLQSPGATHIIIDGEQWAQFYHPLAGQKAFGGTVAKDSPLTCIKCPHGQPGDQLWVRETVCEFGFVGNYLYKADGILLPDDNYKWTPSIHMPRSASRILLSLTGIRVERLQDITEADAKAEGVYYYGWDDPTQDDYKNYLADAHDDWGVTTAKESFQTLWASINGQSSWNKNPWVWVEEFDVLEPKTTPNGQD